MRPLTAAELLQAWESAAELPAVQRGLALLAPACPELDGQALAELPLGRRDGLLLTLRDWTFGARLTALAGCPACGSPVEFAFDSSDIRAPVTENQPSYEVEAGGVRVRFRLPNSRDLLHALAITQDTPGMEAQQARRRILAGCLLAAERGGLPLPVEQVSGEAEAAVVSEMARLDGQADVRLNLACPACGQQWAETFDIAAFFWDELQRWALRLLGEVHSLASTYGWREADILAMSPRRRQLYLHMIHA